MRLLLVSSEFPPGPGGIGTHAWQLARHLGRQGWDVLVLTSQDYAREDAIADFNGALPFSVVRFRRVAGPPFEAFYRRSIVSGYAERWKPDVLLASGERSVWLTAWVSRVSDVPWVAVGHGTEFAVGSAWERRLTRWAYGAATAVVCVSKYTWERMRAAGIDPRDGGVIPNGADAEAFAPMPPEQIRGFKASLGLEHACLVLTVGNLTTRKAQDVVIRAMPRVLDAVPNAHYVMVGIPTQREQLMALARRLGVAERVHAAGAVGNAELVGYLNAADLFVLVSRHAPDGDFEGYGIATVEAALCATPAVVSTGAGLTEAIREGETGLSVPENDPDATARAIAALLQDPGRRRRMGEAARRRALREQTWEHRAADYDALLRRVAGQGESVTVQDADPAKTPASMTLLVISHTPHYWKDGGLVGWGPTVREIDHLACLAERVIHVAPVHPGPAPATALPYGAPGVELRPVPCAGGPAIRDKLGILARTPQYLRAILRELPRSDVVQVRCPANISLLAILLLALVRRPPVRWVKYAGNWRPAGREPWSYAFQRWWLRRRLHRGIVTINGRWPDQPPHVYSFLNPCLTEQELAEGVATAARKTISSTPRLLFVGRLEEAKGAGRALEVLARLKLEGIHATLDLAGDGPERRRFETLAVQLGVARVTKFHGWLPRRVLAELYTEAQILLLPTNSSEGWPKVLSEAMAYGVVAVSSEISSIPQYLAQAGVGRTCPVDDLDRFADAVRWYVVHPEQWRRESAAGARAAAAFSYAAYVAAVREMLGELPGARPC